MLRAAGVSAAGVLLGSGAVPAAAAEQAGSPSAMASSAAVRRGRAAYLTIMQMTVLDADSLEQIARVRVGDGPFNLSVTDDQRTVITADARDNTVTFVDTATLKVRDTVSIGGVHQELKEPSPFQRLNPRISHRALRVVCHRPDEADRLIGPVTRCAVRRCRQ